MDLAQTAVVIGASAGGVAALTRLSGHLPRQLGAAVLVVQHISPTSPGLLAGIIASTARMPVAYGERQQPVLRDHIYVAPPGPHMSVVWPGLIDLDYGPRENYTRPAADVLFRSACKVYGRRVIGVVLTGDDSDGTQGLTFIKKAGGISIVQDPRDAEVPNMPVSALRGDDPDYCVPLHKLPALIGRLVPTLDGVATDIPSTAAV